MLGGGAVAGVTVGGQQRTDVLLEELDALRRRLTGRRWQGKEAPGEEGREQAGARPGHVVLARRVGGRSRAGTLLVYQRRRGPVMRVPANFRRGAFAARQSG